MVGFVGFEPSEPHGHTAFLAPWVHDLGCIWIVLMLLHDDPGLLLLQAGRLELSFSHRCPKAMPRPGDGAANVGFQMCRIKEPCACLASGTFRFRGI